MIRKMLGGWRHGLRVFAMALAALALTWNVALGEAIAASMLGAIAGVIAGELFGRSRVKLAAVTVGAGLFAWLIWRVAGALAGTELLAEAVGPGNALVAVGVLRFGSLAFASVTVMRAVAVRRPAALVLELAFLATAFTAVFSAHREGVIARPLWLSDWAWQQGIDPAQVLLAFGGVSVVILAVLLVAETRSGRAFSSLLVLLVLAAAAVMFIGVVGTPTPASVSELGLTDAGQGGAPRRTDAGPGHGPGDQQGDGGPGGPRPNQGDGGTGSGADTGLADGHGAGADGSGDASGNVPITDGGDGGGSGAGDGSADGGANGGDGGDGGSGGMGDASFDIGSFGMSDGSTGGAPPPQGDGGRNNPPPSSEQLSEQQTPSNSPAPMAVVILDDDYSPPSGAYYFRQEAWSEFNGTRLVETHRSDVDLDVMDEFPTFQTPVRDVPPRVGRTEVAGRVALLVDHAHPFALESGLSFGPLPNPNPQRFTRAWRFRSLAQSIDYRRLIGRRAGHPQWTPEVRTYFTQGPTDPRYLELARRVVTQRLPVRLRTDPFAQALAVKMWMDHEFIYSINPRYSRRNNPNPTADFLFGNRTGYCVHFAHSAVYLWRSLGIPSRISTGYHSDESNRRGGSTILLRGSDAHAWPEIYLEGLGWIVLDVAAERVLDPPGQGSPPDEDLQRILGEMARQQPPTPDEPTPRVQQPKPPYGKYTGYGLLALLGLCLGVMYAVKLWRRVVPAFASVASLPRVAYRAALDRVAEIGFSREFGETRERFAERVAKAVPSFQKVTDMHLAAALGDKRRDKAGRDEYSRNAWREALSAMSNDIPTAAKWWRRALGRINPASWLDAR